MKPNVQLSLLRRIKFDVHVTVHRKIRQGSEPTDATQKEFYSVFLAQHVSGISMSKIRSTQAEQQLPYITHSYQPSPT
jgi:hypothetical protein